MYHHFTLNIDDHPIGSMISFTVLIIQIVYMSNILSIGPSSEFPFLSDEGPMLETLDSLY